MLFGAHGNELAIVGDSNSNSDSYCQADKPSFKLPVATGEGFEKDSSSINGGKVNFKAKEFEVYRVFVRITFIYIYILGK